MRSHPRASVLHPGVRVEPAWSAPIEGLVRTRCTSCHAVDLIEQQRITSDDWVSEVAKMRRWGATLSDDEARTLAAGLSAAMPPDARDYAFERIEPEEALARVGPQSPPWEIAGNAEYGHALFTVHCAQCHGPEARGVRGPGLVGRVIAQRPRDFDRIVRAGR